MIGATDRANELLEIANNSDGAALEAQEIWAESLDAKFKELNNSVTIFWQTLLDSGAIASVVEGLTSIVNGLTKLVDTFGALPTSIFAVTTAYGLFNKQMRQGITTTVSGMIPSLTTLNTKLSESAEAHRAALEFAKIGRAESAAQVVALKTSGQAYAVAAGEVRMYDAMIRQSTLGLIGCRIATIALQTALTMGLSLGISVVIGLFSKLVNS